jgi:hypothetical protein
MDPFTAIIGGLVLVVLLGVIALGVWYPGSGAEQIGWRSPRALAEREAALDADDAAEMLAEINVRRRARGARELTLREVEAHGLPADD